MAISESRIKKWGNSLGIVIPKNTVKEMALKEGEKVSIDIVKKQKINAWGLCKGAKPFHREEDILDR
ncbi:MAG: AbrB/MazE/SpoVT family DNA-binding domain-containing protein [archaeon]